MSETLVKGLAYHGNRMIPHIKDDMRQIAANGFNAVVHMFSHNDLRRHKLIMKDIIEISRENGLDVYLNNWGLPGAPGDPSHFLSAHPGCQQVYNVGGIENPAFPAVMVCYNRPEFIEFTKEWIDAAYDAGARKLTYDEPHMTTADFDENGRPRVWACRCEVCQKLFEERYGRKMPVLYDDDVEEFRLWTFTNYFETVCEYATSKGMENALILKLQADHGICLSKAEALFKSPHIQNIGSDPYQRVEGYVDAYKFIYHPTKENIELCKKYNKDHNVWIRGFGLPQSREEEIIAAADAIYDAGARKIFIWGFRGCDGNDYRMHSPETAWRVMGDAMARITERHRNKLWEEAKKAVAAGDKSNDAGFDEY